MVHAIKVRTFITFLLSFSFLVKSRAALLRGARLNNENNERRLQEDGLKDPQGNQTPPNGSQVLPRSIPPPNIAQTPPKQTRKAFFDSALGFGGIEEAFGVDDDVHFPSSLPEKPEFATDDVHENIHMLGDDIFADFQMDDELHLQTTGYDDWGPSLGLVGDQELVDDAVAGVAHHVILGHEANFGQ